MRTAPALLLFPALCFAAVDGTVVNRTTGRPQPGATVTLFDLSKGMQPAASVKSGADGRFRFEQSLRGPMLLQALHQGVTYSQMLQPGAPATGQELAVYDSARTVAEARLAQHLFLLEPGEGRMVVSESLFYENKGRVTLLGGGPRFFLPPEAGERAQVMFHAPNAMPLRRELARTGEANVYRVDVPIKPGETRLDLTYEIPFTAPGKFSSRFVERASAVRLAVPQGVTVKGEGLEPLGEEPSSRAALFNVTGARLEVEIEGAGALRAADAGAEEEQGPGVQQILPRIYGRLHLILGLSFAILSLGFLLLWRRQVSPPAAGKGAARR